MQIIIDVCELEPGKSERCQLSMNIEGFDNSTPRERIVVAQLHPKLVELIGQHLKEYGAVGHGDNVADAEIDLSISKTFKE